MSTRINGFTVGYTVAGGIVLWSGIKGSSISDTVRSVLAGNNNPAQTEAITAGSSQPAGTGLNAAAGDTSAHGQSAAQNQAIARLSVMASHPNWATGQEWSDWVSLWNQESGWNNLAQNSSSGAFGIAQALGHGNAGTAGKYGNNYPSTAANDGNALAQIQWGIVYISQRYGSPSAAWAHEVANGWY